MSYFSYHWSARKAYTEKLPALLGVEPRKRDAQFSPDGTMIVYQSNETGRFEAWVKPFPLPGIDLKVDDKVQISTDGGSHVRWGRTGKEIFFVGPDGMIVSVPVEVDKTTRALRKGTPSNLFSLGRPFWGGGTALPFYDVSADGSRILTIDAAQPPTTSPITVRLNWARSEH
jgi:hypothetical protein